MARLSDWMGSHGRIGPLGSATVNRSTRKNREHWIQRITFAAETNAACSRCVIIYKRLGRHTHTQCDSVTPSVTISGGESNELSLDADAKLCLCIPVCNLIQRRQPKCWKISQFRVPWQMPAIIYTGSWTQKKYTTTHQCYFSSNILFIVYHSLSIVYHSFIRPWLHVK